MRDRRKTLFRDRIATNTALMCVRSELVASARRIDVRCGGAGTSCPQLVRERERRIAELDEAQYGRE